MVPWPILIDFLISPGTQIEFVLLKNQRSSGFISFYLQSCLYIFGPLVVFAILCSFIPAILMTAYRLRLVLIVILDEVLIAEPLP